MNISRDIITDSETLGRCYIPLEYFDGNEFDILTKERNPYKIENILLKKYAEKMLNMADKLSKQSINLLPSLPKDCRRPCLALLELHQEIGEVIRKKESYVRCAHPGTLDKLKVIVKSMYFTNITSKY